MKYIASLFLISLIVISCKNNEDITPTAQQGRDSSIVLPEGFVATVFAQSLGEPRHIAISDNGDVFVKLQSVKDGRSVLRLRDTNNDGVADSTGGFGDYNGSGIGVKNGYLYTTSNSSIYRYKLGADGTPDAASMETIVEGLVDKAQHNAKTIALDDAGNIYVNIGAPSNACQVDDRQKGSPGMNPCPILDSAGGIWQFKSDKLNQHYADGVRYATGLRNVMALAWNSQTNDLYGVQHGRDDLDRMFPDKFTEAQRVELPAEEMFRLKNGGDFGWPYCYYDPMQKIKAEAPEYGGDGKKTAACDNKQKPIYAFPAHWGPNGMLFYTGDQFPAKYKNGAFIAFHGSWNREPAPQAGYTVVFLAFKDGMPTGEHEVFADGFAGEKKTPGGAKHRPCGLAQGSDGSLYVTDDQGGHIWKISYKK